MYLLAFVSSPLSRAPDDSRENPSTEASGVGSRSAFSQPRCSSPSTGLQKALLRKAENLSVEPVDEFSILQTNRPGGAVTKEPVRSMEPVINGCGAIGKPPVSKVNYSDVVQGAHADSGLVIAGETSGRVRFSGSYPGGSAPGVLNFYLFSH